MKKFQLFIVGNKPKLKVNIVSSPSQKARDTFIKLEQGKKSLFKINGMVYNENVKYAITYSLNEKETTALVQKTGFIDKNWNFAIHHRRIQHRSATFYQNRWVKQV